MIEVDRRPTEPWWAALAVEPPARPGGASHLSRSVFDVLVIGAGVAGLTASVVAASAGQSVALLEAAAQLGGTTFKSGGGYWVPNNSYMRARGKGDDRGETLHYMASLAYPDEYDPQDPLLGVSQRDYDMLATYFDSAAGVVDALVELEALRTREFQSFSGNYEGMVGYHSDLVEEFGRHLAPATADGDQQIGSGLVLQLHAAAVRAGVEIVIEHRVTGVIEDAEFGVAGVIAETNDGPVEVYARRGVVFGTGGFTHDAELASRHFRGPIYGGCAVGTNRGDFVRIGESLGAELGNMANGWLVQGIFEAMVEQRERDDMIFMPSGDSMVFVDAGGRRVVNEKSMYHERTQIHFVRDDRGGWPNRLLIMVFDDAVLNESRPWSNPWPAGARGEPYLITADTLDELSVSIGQRLETFREQTGGFELTPDFAAGLSATIERFNEFAAAGRDEDFHRGETMHEIDWNRAARDGNDRNPTMYPFAETGPYHAVLIAGGTLDTNGGPRIDPGGRVRRADGTPIPRLYGAGNCVASVAGEAYWSGGSTIGPAMTFAYIAASNVVNEPAREPAVKDPA